MTQKAAPATEKEMDPLARGEAFLKLADKAKALKDWTLFERGTLSAMCITYRRAATQAFDEAGKTSRAMDTHSSK